jgi:hypothetical protein
MATLVVNGGRAIITNRLKGAGTEPSFVAVGTGVTAATLADTAIQTEVETRVAGTSTQQTTSTTNDTYQVIGTQSITATRALANAGLMDAVSAGNMFTHGDFAVINLVSGDSLQQTWKVQITS